MSGDRTHAANGQSPTAPSWTKITMLGIVRTLNWMAALIRPRVPSPMPAGAAQHVQTDQSPPA